MEVLKRWNGSAWVPVGNSVNSSGIPSGGLKGQVLMKNSDSDFDLVWGYYEDAAMKPLPITPPLIYLDGIDNTGNGHDVNATEWQDLILSLRKAEKVSGNALWGDKYLILDGNSYWRVQAPTGSNGTAEIVVSVDPTFIPVNTDNWYQASCIFGTELPNIQKDMGILVDKNGYFAIGYGESTIWSSAIYAKDGLPHTIHYSYIDGPKLMAIDGIVVNTFTFAAEGNQPSTWGIGWNNSSANTKIKGKIYSVKWYNYTPTNDIISRSHINNKEYYGF